MTDTTTAEVDAGVHRTPGARDTARFVPPPARAGEHEDPYKYKYIIAIAVTLAAMLELIDTSIVNVAIPHMMGNLGATLDEISWVSTGYIIANVIVIPMSGWLSAYFGRKRYLTGSIALFVGASFMCGAATSLGGLVLWRVVQGLGGGALLSTAQTTLFESFPPDEVGIGQAMFGVGVMVGPTIGPTLGGYIVDNYNWPWIFYINVPLGILAGFMVYTYVHDAAHQARAKSIDVAGILFLATGVGSLQWMLERGERYDWFDSRFVTALCVTAVVSFVLLIWRELTAKEPVINFRVFRSRQLTAGVSIAAFLGLALFGSIFVLPVFLQQLHGFTANQTGLVILPGALASAVTMAWVGRNANRLDARATVTIGALFFMLSMWQLSTLTLDAGRGDLFWPLIWRGLGLGLIFVPLTNATMAELATRDLAQGTGMFNLTRQLGGSMGIAIMATLLTRFTTIAKSGLAEHVTTMDPRSLGRLRALTNAMIGRGASPLVAHQQALAIMDHQISAQASVLAFSKIYLLSGALLLSSLPLLFFFHTGKARTTVRSMH
ncbi:MAG TPA: DHA2 family efflux MFS transporter permease subunit [Gemmatimonadaceae bacterium]|nr:DHA2 family efflux MFS transporter permease subunit [Gemmatimonadaceae bacterium]